MSPRKALPRSVVIVAPPRVTLQDLAGPHEVFERAARCMPGAYSVRIASFGPGLRVRTKFGLEIRCDLSVSQIELPVDTLIVAGSECAVDDPPNPRFLRWLGKAATRTRRVASVCVGSFHLAQAGLLDARRATTHWAHVARFRERFPDVLVEDDPIYTRDGRLYTSAGITAGIDLSLAMVEEDCGADVAVDVARQLVVFLQRPADQPQLSASLALRMADRDPIRHLQGWVPEHLDQVHGVDDLARLVHMSVRNFSRLFRQSTGSTPAAWLRALRVEVVRRRLSQSREAVRRVAERAGFGSERTLRRSLIRSDGLPPSRYRRRATGKGSS
ncbi:MAG: GlxA family transcriptional regulator [Steroidobacteraceae bacterium]